MIVIEEFSKKTTLPIKIDDIASFIIKKGFVSRIVYHPFDIEPGHLAGMLLQDRPMAIPEPYGRPDDVGNIAFSTRLPRDMRRLVQAKELLHICDVNGAQAKTQKEVTELIEWFGIPPDARSEISKISAGIVSDHSGILLALAVLFPEASRVVLKPLFDCGSISASAIAALAHIPESYVGLLMM
jgi:hypothetical protein